MLTLKTVFSKETLKLVYENTKKELKVTGEAFTNFIKVYSEIFDHTCLHFPAYSHRKGFLQPLSVKTAVHYNPIFI